MAIQVNIWGCTFWARKDPLGQTSPLIFGENFGFSLVGYAYIGGL